MRETNVFGVAQLNIYLYTTTTNSAERGRARSPCVHLMSHLFASLVSRLLTEGRRVSIICFVCRLLTEALLLQQPAATSSSVLRSNSNVTPTFISSGRYAATQSSVVPSLSAAHGCLLDGVCVVLCVPPNPPRIWGVELQ